MAPTLLAGKAANNRLKCAYLGFRSCRHANVIRGKGCKTHITLTFTVLEAAGDSACCMYTYLVLIGDELVLTFSKVLNGVYKGINTPDNQVTNSNLANIPIPVTQAPEGAFNHSDRIITAAANDPPRFGERTRLPNPIETPMQDIPPAQGASNTLRATSTTPPAHDFMVGTVCQHLEEKLSRGSHGADEVEQMGVSKTTTKWQSEKRKTTKCCQLSLHQT